MKLVDLRTKDKTDKDIAKILSTKQLTEVSLWDGIMTKSATDFQNDCKKEIDRRDLKNYILIKEKHETIEKPV